MIDYSDFSVVIQGLPFTSNFSNTYIQAKNIKKWFNGTLILSTWEGVKLPLNHSFDSVVFSLDPGSVVINNKNSNINRQLISSLAGIKAAKTEYVIKIRSDNYIELNSDILKKIRMLGKQSIMSFNVTCKNPAKSNLYCHFSDWVLIGKKETMINLFSVPNQLKTSNLSAEQHIFFNYALQKYEDKISLQLAHEFLSNFILIESYKKIKLKSIKPGYFRIPFGINGLHGYLCEELEGKSKMLIKIIMFKELIIYRLIQFFLRVKSKYDL